VRAELQPGAPFVLDALDFDERMRAARAVVTGEGKLDEQTLEGKLVGEIGTRARQAGVPLHAIVGRDALDAFGKRMIDLQVVREATTDRRDRGAPPRNSAARWPRAARDGPAAGRPLRPRRRPARQRGGDHRLHQRRAGRARRAGAPARGAAALRRAAARRGLRRAGRPRNGRATS
jgi:hypothetical protein